MNEIRLIGEVNCLNKSVFYKEIKYNIYEIKCANNIATTDNLILYVSEDKKLEDFTIYKITGKLISYNKKENEKIHMITYVLLEDYTVVDAMEIAINNITLNTLELDAIVCKEPVVRKTQKETLISEIVLVYNDNEGKNSYYYHCKGYGNISEKLQTLKLGDKVHIVGRLQSRSYINKDGINGIAYEIGLGKVYKIKES